MAKPQTIVRDGSGTRSVTYQLPPGLFQYIESVLVSLSNGAAVAVRPTLKVETVNGRVMATKRQGEAVPAGDTGTATWALRLTDEGGGGIKFDTHPQEGQYLIIDTTGGGFGGFGILLRDAGSEIRLESDDGAGNGQIDLASPFIRFDTDGASLRLLDSGETFFEGDGGASWFFDTFDLEAAPITLSLSSAGSKFEIQDHNGNPIFRVNENGDLQGKTGKALTFNL